MEFALLPDIRELTRQEGKDDDDDDAEATASIIILQKGFLQFISIISDRLIDPGKSRKILSSHSL